MQSDDAFPPPPPLPPYPFPLHPPGTTGSSVTVFAGLTCDTIRYTYYISSSTFSSLNPVRPCLLIFNRLPKCLFLYN